MPGAKLAVFFAVAADAHVAGDDSGDPLAVINDAVGGETRADLHAQRLGLLGQPGAQKS